jgi:hypothetical protein
MGLPAARVRQVHKVQLTLAALKIWSAAVPAAPGPARGRRSIAAFPRFRMPRRGMGDCSDEPVAAESILTTPGPPGGAHRHSTDWRGTQFGGEYAPREKASVTVNNHLNVPGLADDETLRIGCERCPVTTVRRSSAL